MALLFICSNSFLGSAQAAIGDLFNRTEIKPYAQHASSETANLPATLYNSAVVDSVVEDYEYDYVKLNRISSLPLFPRGYRAPKYLVDKVVVYKQYHQMMLYKNNQVVRKYWIALSDRPQGHKIQEGDRRTPEGTYTLDYVKENSYYYRAFHISYPNPQDIANARKRGVSPGGMIMVHGQPPSNSEYHETVQRSDWTNGCIAILNPEMDEFISLVDPGTPIEIKP
ncbi:L,D-transpeptidase family protein [Anaerobiospirillum succiniciproducens]|nr:L,D-transpeptidase family protein [Anaerobiospirillum succiniciproducens]MCI6864233.1 L,D-transpeptidase family protein [Anaerobiospirillum succiniciproducens]